MNTIILIISTVLDIFNLSCLYRERSNRHAAVRLASVLMLFNILAKAFLWVFSEKEILMSFLNSKAVVVISAAISISISILIVSYHYLRRHKKLKSDITVSANRIDPETLCNIPSGKTFVVETEGLYVIFPEYTDVRLVIASDAAERNPDISFWGSGPYKSGVFHNDIDSVIGPFLINGSYYDSGLRAGEMLLGAFISDENGFGFYSPQDSERAFRNASGKQGAYGFSSNLFILNGEPRSIECTYNSLNCFRALGDFRGSLCIIDSKRMTHFNDFFDEIKKLGLSNAIAMDMGAYSNYSWFIDSTGNKTQCCHHFLNKSAAALTFCR